MFEIVHYLFDCDYTNDEETVVKETIYHPRKVSAGFGLVSATLSVELNSAGSLEFTLPVVHPKYSTFHMFTSECTVEQDGVEIWRGFVSEQSVDFDGSKTIVCTGIQAYLNDSIICVEGGSYTPENLLLTLINNHNSQMTKKDYTFIHPMAHKCFVLDDTDITDSVAFDENAGSYETTWSIVETNLLEALGGYVKVYRGADGYNHITYLEAPGNESTQVIRYGVNLLDLNFRISTEDFFTVLLPTAQSVEDNEIQITLDPMINTEGALKYGYIWQVFTLNRTDAEDDYTLEIMLANAAAVKLGQAGLISTVEGTALDWHNIDVDVDSIRLGDSNLIYSDPNGLVGNQRFVCNKIDYDLLYWEQTDYAFGDTEQSMTAQNIFNANDAARKIEERLNKRLAEAEEQIKTGSTPYAITFVLDSSNQMTCNKKVSDVVTAIDAGRTISAINEANGEWFTVQAQYSVSASAYTVIFVANTAGAKWRGNNLSAGDTLVLQIDN